MPVRRRLQDGFSSEGLGELQMREEERTVLLSIGFDHWLGSLMRR